MGRKRESRVTTFREEHIWSDLGTVRSISEPGVKGDEETMLGPASEDSCKDYMNYI